MFYTIKQVAQITGLSEYTIRYYDREGLLPQLKRTESGIRKFSDNDIEWLKLICCLKNSGMPISKLSEFMKLCMNGNETCEQRKDLLVSHKEQILKKIADLQKSLKIVEYKINNYKQIGIFHLDTDVSNDD